MCVQTRPLPFRPVLQPVSSLRTLPENSARSVTPPTPASCRPSTLSVNRRGKLLCLYLLQLYLGYTTHECCARALWRQMCGPREVSRIFTRAWPVFVVCFRSFHVSSSLSASSRCDCEWRECACVLYIYIVYFVGGFLEFMPSFVPAAAIGMSSPLRMGYATHMFTMALSGCCWRWGRELGFVFPECAYIT